MKQWLVRFAEGEEGQDLIEYALLAAFLALGVVAILSTLRGGLQTLFGNVNNNLTTAS
jgi:Flp pilus assembly pilin Flp